MMPLSLAGMGEENTIKKIGGNPEVKKHLENLGFVVGGTVKVISTLGGNVIVNVKEARVFPSCIICYFIATVKEYYNSKLII